jgi:hypothetical protein
MASSYFSEQLNLKGQCHEITSFYIDGCGTLRTVALRRPIFKPKKGSATISLGLNYCSMGLSQPPFRDTVPFNKQTGYKGSGGRMFNNIFR